jgi:hypothetical protein
MATLPDRKFAVSDAKREKVPLLIGLTGPSGGGKTFSALRLATGIQTVTGGDIFFIDTESRRALHYADKFKFKHVPFDAPFGSLDYLAALQFCVNSGAGVVIVDSMSHEHEGPGGMVDLHDQIVDRMAGNDYAKRERVKMLAWSEPKQKRRSLINGILQLNANFIFCFRAKNTSKPVKGNNGKTEVQQMGFMPIAGEEFVFEQTMNALLLPGAGGVPTWFSNEIGERTMIKLPEQFAALRDRNKPLDESVGKRLAMWSTGSPTLVKTADDNRTFTATESSPAGDGSAEAGPSNTGGDAGAAQEDFAEGPDDSQRGDGDSDAEARAAITDYVKAVKDAPNPAALDAAYKRGDELAATIRRDFPDLYAEIDRFRPVDAPEKAGGLPL